VPTASCDLDALRISMHCIQLVVTVRRLRMVEPIRLFGIAVLRQPSSRNFADTRLASSKARSAEWWSPNAGTVSVGHVE